MRIDAHQHFWAINDADYVWMSDEHDVIRRDFLPDDLKPLLNQARLDGCVAVQARQMAEETSWLLELADRHDQIAGVVGWVPLATEAGEPFLEEFASHPKLVGVRHVVHDEPDDDFVLRADFGEGIRRLGEYGLVYELLIFERHLPQCIAFVDRHPSQPFVVDHIAKPQIRAGAFDQKWADGIRELAQREHVSCKLSGMVTEVRGGGWDADLLRPYFETVLEAFGVERLMFGSDWPVLLLRSEYGEWFRCVEELTSTLSAGEQASIWGGSAERAYGLGDGGIVAGDHLFV
ncbi:MAG: L-fuconolactonase [Rhodothermales bacterium]|jgi:L-fuconolactonase